MLEDAEVDRHQPGLRVLDLGGQNVNGTVHDWFTDAVITTLDLENADIIADATDWYPSEDQEWDVVIATEVFEHVQHWPAILDTAWAALVPGGAFITTCASTHRPAHGATGAPAPVLGEWYLNVPPLLLEQELAKRFRTYGVEYRYPPGDAYAWARC